MLAVTLRRRGSSEGEKPFWISFADLMTAMMTLFLATMAVTMLVVTKKVEQKLSAEEERAKDIRRICEEIQQELPAGSFARVDCQDNRIEFGEVGKFAFNDYKLPEGANEALAQVVPIILDVADGERGRKWLKQVLIEGFTDTDGSYLYNLHLSLQRSEWVMCMLLDSTHNTKLALSEQQLQRVRELFLAGGVSFNNPKRATDGSAAIDKDLSRRVELRLQFYGLNRDPAEDPSPTFLQNSRGEKCMLQ